MPCGCGGGGNKFFQNRQSTRSIGPPKSKFNVQISLPPPSASTDVDRRRIKKLREEAKLRNLGKIN